MTARAIYGSLSVLWSWSKKSGSGRGTELENIPVRALKGGVGGKKIVFYTFEATNLLKTKEGECKTKLKTKLKQA